METTTTFVLVVGPLLSTDFSRVRVWTSLSSNYRRHSICTTQAAPTISSQRRVADDEDALRRIFAKFQEWQTLRCVLQLVGFGAALWGVVAYAAVRTR